MNGTDTARPIISRFQGMALVAGAIGILATVAGLFVAPDHFWPSYLLGFLLWNGITVGFLGILMLHHMVGGEWGFVNRRLYEAGAMCSVLMAVLFVPIALGTSHIFPWDPTFHHGTMGSLATHPVVAQKLAYLNPAFFWVRGIIYFLFWIGTAFLLNSWSADVDKTGSPTFRTKARALSAPGLLIYTLLYTFYAVDMAMSLEPKWYSTIFALILMIGGVLGAFSLTAILMVLFKDTDPLSRVYTRDRFHDIGNLMLTFTCLWAYMSFSQYLITWAGNLPEEAEWYVKRLTGPWVYVAIALMVFHFFVPFFLLLQRVLKKAPARLAVIAALLIAMRYLDLYFIVKPAYEGQLGEHFYWTDLAAPIGIGGVWFFAFLFFLKSKNLLPVWETHHDRVPTKHEVYQHG
jgi:hypothetical protein